MEEYSRRAASGLVISRKAPNVALRDSADNNRERNGQVCSRAGCSSKLSSMKATQIGSPSKAKTLRTPFRSSGHGKEIIGSSSRTPVAVNSLRKSFSDSKKKPPSRVETYSESSSLQEESEEVSEPISTSGKAEMMVHSEPENHKQSEAGSSSSGPSNRLVKRNSQRFGSGRQESPAGSSASSAFKPGNQGARNGASTSRYNLKNLRCNSSSDVVPSGSSSPIESNLGKKRDNGRKRIGELESSSSARGKKINGPMLDNRRNDTYNRGISISDSRRSRNLSPSGYDDTAYLRTRRSSARTRLSNQENQTRLPLVESPLMSPSSPQPDMSLDARTFSSENQFSAQTLSHRASSFSRQGSSSDHTWPNRSIGPYEVGISRSFMNRDALRQYNLDGIAEMLLALERIEQEEEPTYEQLLVLETNLFLGGLAFHDQHRDMRLDIDNMSYEELLALEERMGTVSTALSVEDLAKCLRRSIYQGIAECREDGDDVKCSICQEEYADGHEVGKLKCDHRYHVECIDQWLRLKNWCPICKASAAAAAAPSPSPSPSPSLSASPP